MGSADLSARRTIGWPIGRPKVRPDFRRADSGLKRTFGRPKVRRADKYAETQVRFNPLSWGGGQKKCHKPIPQSGCHARAPPATVMVRNRSASDKRSEGQPQPDSTGPALGKGLRCQCCCWGGGGGGWRGRRKAPQTQQPLRSPPQRVQRGTSPWSLLRGGGGGHGLLEKGLEAPPPPSFA